MFREADPAGLAPFLATRPQVATTHWGVSSETALLTDVLVSAPAYLAMVPCNAVTRDSLAKGLLSSPVAAAAQHRQLVRALERAGVRCHLVPPSPHLPDLTFTRDAALMSPWGLIELRPAAGHRRDEPGRVAAAVAAAGAPSYARIARGWIEGGDVCMIRDGLLLIGCSGDRTDETGARALGGLFERRGWEVVYASFDPEFLHLDTLLTMVAPDCAVACPEALGDSLVAKLGGLGIGIIPASADEVAGLGANLLSLGGGRLLVPAANHRLNDILARCGFDVVAVEIDQFTRCGGGIHCLTLPLARDREACAG